MCWWLGKDAGIQDWESRRQTWKDTSLPQSGQGRAERKRVSGRKVPYCLVVCHCVKAR